MAMSVARSILTIAAVALLLPTPLSALEQATLPGEHPAEQQAAEVPPPTRSQPPVQTDGSIIVLGEELPTDVKILGAFRSLSRGLSADSQMFLRCADLPPPAVLSAILDEPPHRRQTQRALHRYIQQNEGCYPRLNRSMSVPELGRCNPVVARTPLVFGVATVADAVSDGARLPTICRVTYDRGALYEQALLQQGGDLDLSREDTFNPLLRQRFMQREEVRNDGRAQLDRDYFDTVACMVQISPEQGVAVITSAGGSAQEEEAVVQLVGHGGPCIGYAKDVRFDRGQFRAYVAEALYSWIAAKRGVDSLVS
jgi:hypothetical protein